MKNETLYDKYLAGRHWELHPTIYAEQFCEFLIGKEFDGKLVDLGCSTGRDVQVFSQNRFEAVGIDYAESDIAIARERYSNCCFEVMNVEQLSFLEKSVGAFFMINVIHYVDQEKAFHEILRTLKSGGFLFIHFNLSITDEGGNIDYQQDEPSIFKNIALFHVVHEKRFERQDTIPKLHTHEILELILQKP